MTKRRKTRSTRERSDVILHIMQSRRSMKVVDLCALLNVSEITIRRDLNLLAEKGFIRRTHGGAMLVDTGEDSMFFAHRAKQHPERKQALAREAIRLIPQNGSIYLDSGSTCFEIAKQLAASGKECLVVTDSILVMQELFGLPRLNTMVLGGSLARDRVTLDGHLAVENAKQLAVDVCLFSANSFNDEQIYNQYLSGVATKEMMISRAKRSICVIDSSKYAVQSCFHFCSWEAVDAMITDSRFPETARDAITAKNVDILVAEMDA